MSATAAVSEKRSKEVGAWAPLPARLFLTLFSAAVICALLAWTIANRHSVASLLPQMCVWAAIIVVSDFLAVDFSQRINLTMSLSVTLAAGMVLPPMAAGLLAFVASADAREFRGEIKLERGLFNRSQVAVSVTAAAFVFHAHAVPISSWPMILVPAALAISVDCFTNLALISIAAGLVRGVSPVEVLRGLVVDAPVQYLLTYAALGLLALLMATVVDSVGMWGAAAFLAPLALARQTMVETRRSHEALEASELRERALLSTYERIVSERRDERIVVADELHDEILPPLFKVHLLAQVLNQDLTSGRLLDLDEDLPELVKATKIAQDAVRLLVSDLRRSRLGPGGLNLTLRHRASELESAGSPRIELELQDDADVSHLSQLLAYQVLREAMMNAVSHSRASNVRIQSRLEDGFLRLVVEDDGIGFDPRSVDQGHFGSLQLIAALLEAAKGQIVIDSRLGSGTTVSALLPAHI